MEDASGNKLYQGAVVQIDPEHDPRFAGCFMLVTEPKSFGAMGFIQVPGDEGGQAYYRCPSKAMALIGGAMWWPRDCETET